MARLCSVLPFCCTSRVVPSPLSLRPRHWRRATGPGCTQGACEPSPHVVPNLGKAARPTAQRATVSYLKQHQCFEYLSSLWRSRTWVLITSMALTYRALAACLVIVSACSIAAPHLILSPVREGHRTTRVTPKHCENTLWPRLCPSRRITHPLCRAVLPAGLHALHRVPGRLSSRPGCWPTLLSSLKGRVRPLLPSRGRRPRL